MPFLTRTEPDPATFEGRQKYRDQYQEIADTLRGIIEYLPAQMQPEVKRYTRHIADVIAKGATASDLSEIKGKLAEWTDLEKKLLAPAPGKPIAIAVSPEISVRKKVLTEPASITDSAGQYLSAIQDVNPLYIAGAVVVLFMLFKR